MNHVKFSIFVSILLFATVFSVTGTSITDESELQSSELPSATTTRDMWDLLFKYDTGLGYLAGAEFDGTYFYCPDFNSPNIHRFDRDGNYVDAFTIPGVSKLKDLAYDGTYMYGGRGYSQWIWEMDFATQTLVSTIYTTVDVMSCAYDEDADGGNGGFWVNNWGSRVSLLDRSGVIIDSFLQGGGFFGSAWDNWSEVPGYNGPFLWVLTGLNMADDGIIKQYDLDTKTLTGIEYNVAQDLGDGMCGGLFLTHDWNEGFVTLGGIIQGADGYEYIFGYEIGRTNSPPETPEVPTGPSSGAVGVEYTFYTNTTDPEGEQVYYMWDWGDGTVSDWIGPFDSGANAPASHSWAEESDYNIKVKAKDGTIMESGWSDPKAIHIVDAPILEIGNITGGLFKVRTVIKNTGSVDAVKINWSITLDGGVILLGKETSGMIVRIPAGDEKTISSNLIIGLGKTTITVTAECAESSDTKEREALVLLCFIKI